MTKQDIEKRLADWNKAAQFPKALYPDGFQDWLHKAMETVAPVNLQMDSASFRALYFAIPKSYNMYDMGIAIHIIETRTAEQLGMNMEDYCDVMDAITKAGKDWYAVIKPKQDELEQEFKEFQESERLRRQNEEPVEVQPIYEA